MTELAWLIVSSLIREAAFGATGNSQAALDKWEGGSLPPFLLRPYLRVQLPDTAALDLCAARLRMRNK